MNIKIGQNSKIPSELALKKNPHTIVLFDEKQSSPLLSRSLLPIIKRQGGKISDLKKSAISAELDNGNFTSTELLNEIRYLLK